MITGVFAIVFFHSPGMMPFVFFERIRHWLIHEQAFYFHNSSDPAPQMVFLKVPWPSLAPFWLPFRVPWLTFGDPGGYFLTSDVP